MSEELFTIIALYAVFEYVEFINQKGNSLREILLYNLELSKQNIYLYMFSHSTFFMLLVLVFVFGISNVFIYIALLMKGADLGFKFYLVGKINKEGDSVLANLFGGMEIPLGMNLKILNSAIYITLVALSLLQ